MAKAIDVANYVIQLKNKDEKSGEYYSLSNLKLQKILYYCQGGHYKWDHSQLIDDQSFEAWTYGPVIRTIYYKFKKFGQNDINTEYENFSLIKLSQNEKETIESVWNQLKGLAAFKLVELTHSEAPWVETYNNKEIMIQESKIKMFFSKK